MRLSIVSTIFLLALLLTGCTTRKKATRWMYTHPGVLAEVCANHYPVKTEYLPGKTIVKTDTLINQHDSIYCPEDKNGRIRAIVCPPSKTVTVYTQRTDTLIQENTAKLAVLTNDLNKAKETIESEKARAQKADKRFTIAVIVGLCLLIAARTFKL